MKFIILEPFDRNNLTHLYPWSLYDKIKNNYNYNHSYSYSIIFPTNILLIVNNLLIIRNQLVK